MPRMDTPMNRHALVKMLLIGAGKIGKTHYAGMAAAAGLNVLYLDGDVGAQTLAGLPMEARKHIYLMQMADRIDGGTRTPDFIQNMTELTSYSKMAWNDHESRIASRKDSNYDRWTLQPAKLDHRDLLVIDSWTGLTESIMLKCAQGNGIDLATATTAEMRPVYQSSAQIATSILQVIRSMRCHVIVISHPDEYVHLKKPEGRRVSEAKEGDMVIEYTKLIPKTTSKPQGLQMAKYFTDVAWAEMSPSGKERRLNFQVKNDRVSGGHFDGFKSADSEYSFAELIRQVGGVLPETHESPIGRWLEIESIGEAEAPASKVLDGTKAKGLAGLAVKK